MLIKQIRNRRWAAALAVTSEKQFSERFGIGTLCEAVDELVIENPVVRRQIQALAPSLCRRPVLLAESLRDTAL